MKNKKTWIAVGILAAMIIAAAVCWLAFKPQAVQGDKTIVVEITHKDETKNEFTIHTDEEYLYDAMKQEGLVGELKDGMIFVIDGETADPDAKEWWMYTKSEEYVPVGVDECVIQTGDHYEFYVYAE